VNWIKRLFRKKGVERGYPWVSFNLGRNDMPICYTCKIGTPGKRMGTFPCNDCVGLGGNMHRSYFQPKEEFR